MRHKGRPRKSGKRDQCTDCGRAVDSTDVLLRAAAARHGKAIICERCFVEILDHDEE